MRVLVVFLQLEAPASSQADPNSLDWATVAEELDTKSPLEIMDHVRLLLGHGKK